VRITVLLITAIGTLVFVSAGLVLSLSGVTALRNTVELLHEIADNTINTLERDVTQHLAPVHNTIEHLTHLTEAGAIHPSDQGAFIAAMQGAIAAAPQVSGVVFWDSDETAIEVFRDENGEYVTRTDQRIEDPQILEFLATDLSGIDARWRRPTHEDGFTFINVAGPLYHDGEFLGVLAAGIAISQLSQFLDSEGDSLDMTAFILYGTQHVLAHPSFEAGLPASIGAENPLPLLANLDDQVLRQFHETSLLEEPRARGLALREIGTEDQDYLVLSRTTWSFGQTAWHIGIYAPEHDLVAQLKRLFVSIGAGGIIVLLAILSAILLARYIARPILALASSAERIGRLEVSDITRLPRSRVKELDEQAVAFNRMLEGLKWFEAYVPKRLVNRLIAGQVDTSVGSHEEELTVMFTDIIGFTAMSETMAPGAVGDMLNAHFETLNRCIEAEGGTLDKYIGDAVMAFWGAPETQEDHAARACRAALCIAEALERGTGEAADHPPVRIKIALHTGKLLVGNIGAKARMNYTVIGDTVNACSRIEALCARFDDGAPAIILVSDETAKRTAHDAFEFEAVGDFEVKGRRETVKVSRLVRATGPSD
jgi:adenylate cyclase